MKHKLAVICSLAILIFGIGSVSLVAAQSSTIGTYGSDYTTPKTVFSATDNVYFKWTEESPVYVQLFAQNIDTEELVLVDAPADNHFMSGPLTSGHWRAWIVDPFSFAVIGEECYFTVAEPSIVVTPENDFGSLVALMGCFAAFGAVGIYRLKKN